MKSKNIVFALVAAGVLGASGFGIYRLGMQHAAKTGQATGNSTTEASGAGANAADAGKKPLYWHDPMVPTQKFDKPGKSPFMDMQLVPVYGDAADEGSVSISSRVQQNLGIRTALVSKGSLAATVSAVGSVAYNERDVVLMQARSNGFVERLYVRAALDPVRKGQALAQLYVPDWVAAQEEFLSAKRIQTNGIEGLADGARQRMRLAGMSDDQMRIVETSGKVQARVTITAPVSGVITELAAREGMTVMAGAPLFKINGIGTVWVNAEIPENISGQVRPGAAVEARTPALPGTVFKGKVGAILPEINAATRTLKARVELANQNGQLVPGMFATLSFAPASRADVLLVPSEAVIQTGTRSVVMIAQGDGKFAPTDVETGAETNGQTEIRKGLAAGQKVVVSGQFLIDSEASLKGTVTRMSEAPALDSGKSEGPVHHGAGKIEKVGKDEITISHGPIASLQWGAMTMPFKAPPGGLPRNVGVGDSVAFDLLALKDGTFQIKAISPTVQAPAQPKDTKSMDMKPMDMKSMNTGGPASGEKATPVEKAGKKLPAIAEPGSKQ